MSFSIPLKGATIAEVQGEALPALERIAEEQTAHAADMDAALNVLSAYLELLGEPPEGMYISGGMSGSVGVWDGRLQSVAVAVNLQFIHQVPTS